jgi:hypothetical protein
MTGEILKCPDCGQPLARVIFTETWEIFADTPATYDPATGTWVLDHLARTVYDEQSQVEIKVQCGACVAAKGDGYTDLPFALADGDSLKYRPLDK